MTDKERRDVIAAIKQAVRLYEYADNITAKADEILAEMGVMPAYSLHKSPITGRVQILCVKGFDDLVTRLGVTPGPRKWFGKMIDDDYTEFDLDGTTIFKFKHKEDDDE